MEGNVKRLSNPASSVVNSGYSGAIAWRHLNKPLPARKHNFDNHASHYSKLKFRNRVKTEENRCNRW